MTEVEAAAERLDKEMNTDLESDCEAVISVSKINKQQPRQISTTTTMSKSNNDKRETSTTTVSRSNNGKGGISSTTKPNNLQRKNDNGNLL